MVPFSSQMNLVGNFFREFFDVRFLRYLHIYIWVSQLGPLLQLVRPKIVAISISIIRATYPTLLKLTELIIIIIWSSFQKPVLKHPQSL
jgi:branched-subunit amino acid permease